MSPSPSRERRCPRPRALAAALLVCTASTASAQASGKILINLFSSPRIECIRTDGSAVWTSTGGTGSSWEGCSVTPLGHVVTTRRNPQPGVDVFDANGVQVGTFDTPQVALPGDVSVFMDGTLAVVDQIGGVQLYTEAGVYLGPINTPGPGHRFGSHVDAHDDLFVCGMTGPTGFLGMIQKYDRAGQLLQTMPLGYRPGDVVSASDGTLWVTEREGAKVRHLDAGGAQLGEFPVAVVGYFAGIALASDGTLWLTGEGSALLYQYSQSGTALGTLAIPGAANGTPLFLSIADCAGMLTYCSAKVNSIGCTPAIDSTGNPSASASSGFAVRAANVRNQKAGLLIYSLAGRNNAPFQGGFLCVLPPVRRTPGTTSGGSALPTSDCTGVYSIDMNAFGHGLLGGTPLPALTVSGTLVDCQWWGRDPGFPFPNNSTLSAGLEYSICP